MHILITGASGFLGGHVAARLRRDGHRLTLQGSSALPAGAAPDRSMRTGPLETFDHWPDLLADVDAVVSLAGRAHVLKEAGSDPEAAFRVANETAVLRLTEAMRRQGIGRLIHVSSIAAKLTVNAYGRSKLAGERAVEAWAGDGGGSAVILRPPLIYGPGAPGNLARLIRLIRLGVPLPFALVANRRSLLAADNAADAIATILAGTPGSGAARYELCDDGTVSLPEIVRALAAGLGRRVTLLPFPQGVLAGMTGLVSRSMADALFESLVLDNVPFRQTHGWRPAVQTTEGLKAMGRAPTSPTQR